LFSGVSQKSKEMNRLIKVCISAAAICILANAAPAGVQEKNDVSLQSGAAFDADNVQIFLS